MIEINTIEDLKPYAKYVETKYTDGCCSSLIFEIVENGVLADVKFINPIDLTFSLDNVGDNVFDIEEKIAEDNLAVMTNIKLVAKDICAMEKFVCDYVECENFYCENIAKIDFLLVKFNIKGDTIIANNVACERIDVDFVKCDDVSVVDFKAGKFIYDDIEFTGFEYHSPTFAEKKEKSWNIEKYNANFILYQQVKGPF